MLGSPRQVMFTVDYTVELCDGGMDSGDQVLISGFCPLGPYKAQALMGHHHLEQLLGREGSDTQPCHITHSCPQLPIAPESGDWSELAFKKLRMCPEPCESP